MGVCLKYTTTEPLSPTQSEAIIADAHAAVRDSRQPWLWCEPLSLFPPEADGKLWGLSKLNFSPHPDDQDDADDYPDAENDIHFLVKQLCRLSRDHAVTWELMIDSDPLGKIVDGTCEPGLEESIEAFAAMGDDFADLDPHELGLDDLE
jgi:hypothetical protein